MCYYLNVNFQGQRLNVCRPRGRRFEIILIMFSRIVWERVHWMDLAHDRYKWRVVVNTLMNFRIPQNARNSFTSRVIVVSQDSASLSYIGLRVHREPVLAAGCGLANRRIVINFQQRQEIFPSPKGPYRLRVTRSYSTVQYVGGTFTTG